MNLVHKEKFTAKVMKLPCKLEKVMRLKVGAVDRNIERPVRVTIPLPDVLQHQRCLSRTPRPKNTDTTLIPVNTVVEVSFYRAHRCNQPIATILHLFVKLILQKYGINGKSGNYCYNGKEEKSVYLMYSRRF